jgi:hypothetical protein
MPVSLVRLGEPDAFVKSWATYLEGTEAYLVQLHQWQDERKLKPDAQKPDPFDIVNELFATIMNFNSGQDDHLTVKLVTPSKPGNSNGEWDEAGGRVIWDFHIEGKDPGTQLPAFCYAFWSKPNDSFQEEHFGRTILSEEELGNYCLWHGSLTQDQASQWEAWMSQLKPTSDFTNMLSQFNFERGTSNELAAFEFGRNLLKMGVEKPH